MVATSTEALLMRRQTRPDPVLLALVVALSAAGFVMMGSASMDYAAEQYGNPFYHILRHGIYLALGAGALYASLQLPVKLWESAGPALLVIGLAVLALLLVPGIGREVNGATRWIGFGPVNLQPSELMKLFFVVYLAGYMTRRQRELRASWFGMLKPLGLLGLVMGLLLLEPDFGAAVVIAGTSMAMLFLGGARLLPFIVLLALALVGAGFVAVWSPYRLQRLITFLDPWSDMFASGYQLTQALIAFGRGEIFGLGLGEGIQKLFYLPEAHNDFIFAVIAEELGVVGALTLIALFALLVIRIFRVGRTALLEGNYFGGYLAYGVGLMLGFQCLVNLGVNTGVLPTKGLTLPFVSYGGNRLMVSCAMIGFVLRLQLERSQRD